MPTAQPIITPRLELWDDDAGALVEDEDADAEGVVTSVKAIVWVVEEPVDTEVLTVVMGVADAVVLAAAVPVDLELSVTVWVADVPAEEPADEPPPVVDGEELPDPEARPVTVLMLGAEDAVDDGMEAYAVPSASWKKGRAVGDSLQQFTCIWSALQHQSLL